MEEHNAHSRAIPSTTQTSGHRTLTSNGSNYAVNRKIMLFAVIVLIATVSIMVCFHVYSRWMFGRRRRSTNRRGLLQASAGAHSGLSLSILKALPIFVYLEDCKPAVGDRSATALECSVCLSEFEDKEEGRELPKCKHIFHLECIDMWFGSHSTCPLCRAPVELELDHRAGPSKCEAGGSSSGSGELVGVVVEVPSVIVEKGRGNFSGSGSGSFSCSCSSSGSPVQHCFTQKSTGDQVLTLKRIWSV